MRSEANSAAGEVYSREFGRIDGEDAQTGIADAAMPSSAIVSAAPTTTRGSRGFAHIPAPVIGWRKRLRGPGRPAKRRPSPPTSPPNPGHTSSPLVHIQDQRLK